MPGIQRHWPEGKFYGFDTIYDAAALDYRGPEFGWWRIPDQYTLDFLYRRELRAPGRQPVFAVMATVMSHRSEEHTSELQSLMRISYAVFCLKKKKQTTTQQIDR